MDNEIAFSLITLVKVLFWVDFENIIGHLETNWLHFFGHLLAWLLDVAESLV